MAWPRRADFPELPESTWRAANGVAAAGYAWLVAGDELTAEIMPAPLSGRAGRLLFAASSGLLQAASQGLSDRLLAWGDRQLVRLGVPGPRLAVAAATFVATLGVELLDRRFRDDFEEWEPAGTVHLPMPDHIRTIVFEMIDLLDEADVLHAQLDEARIVRDIESDETSTEALGSDQSCLDFEVSEDAPRLLPLFQRLPVRAEFTESGHRYAAHLMVSDGLVDFLEVSVLDDLDQDETYEALVSMRWPAAEQISVVRETVADARPRP